MNRTQFLRQKWSNHLEGIKASEHQKDVVAYLLDNQEIHHKMANLGTCLKHEADETAHLLELGVPPIVYDNASTDGVITKRLIILMKKMMRVIGDEPKLLAMDGSQFFDDDQEVGGREDFPAQYLNELGLEGTFLPRRFHFLGQGVKNRFCIMVGENKKIVIGTY